MDSNPGIRINTENDIETLLLDRFSERNSLYQQYLNPRKVRSAGYLGLDRQFIRASGCYLYDQQGKQYLDMDAGNGVFNIGRNHPDLRKALNQLLSLEPANWVARGAPLSAGLLAEALTKELPNPLNKVIFTNTGSETTEAALKFARRCTGRTRILYLEGDFHGLTYGALSVTGGNSRTELMGQKIGPMLPDCMPLPWGDIDALEAALKHRDVAALIVEPIQGATGKPLKPEYLLAAADLCRASNTLLIADEVLTGLGRTGRFMACDHHGVIPDIALFAKALSGGMIPVGALVIREDIFEDVLVNQGAFIHGSTFAENDYAMIAGLITLNLIRQQKLIEQSHHKGYRLFKLLTELQQRSQLLEEIRGVGLFIGIQLRAPGHWLRRPLIKILYNKGLLGHLLAASLMDRHRIISSVPMRNNVLRIHPPLNVDDNQIDHFVEAFAEVLDSIGRFQNGCGELMIKRILSHYFHS